MLTRRKKKRAEINIIPLVDVLVVLIFFFIMAMQFNDFNVLDITPPKIGSAKQAEFTERLVIGIDEDADYYLNNEIVKDEELVTALEEAAEREEKPQILLLADENSPLKRVTFVMDQARRLDFDKVKLQAQ